MPIQKGHKGHKIECGTTCLSIHGNVFAHVFQIRLQPLFHKTWMQHQSRFTKSCSVSAAVLSLTLLIDIN